MTKDGAVEQNVTIGEEKRISNRDMGFDLRMGTPVDGFTDEATPFSEVPNQVVKSADTPIKPDNHATHGSSSQVGTRFGDRGEDNTEVESGKQKTLRIRRKQALSQNKDNTEVPTSKTPLADFSENNITPHKSPLQSGAAIYDFPVKTESDESATNADTPREGINRSKLKTTPATDYDPRGRISHKSKTPTTLTQHRLSNMSQSPKSNKFTVVPPIDSSGRHTDKGTDTGKRKPPKQRQNQQPRQSDEKTTTHQNADTLVYPSKLKFADDEIDGTNIIDDVLSDEVSPGVTDQDISTQEENLSHQPRSPTVTPTSSKKKQVRHSRQDAVLTHGTASGRDEQGVNFSTDEKPTGSTPKSKNQRLKNADTADDKRSDDDSTDDFFEYENSDSSDSEQTDTRHDGRQGERQSEQTDLDTPKPSRKISKLEHGVDKTAGKLDKAKGKLSAKRKLRMERTFDEDSGKGKTRLTFDKEVISQREHLKGALPLRPVKFAANTAIAKAHMKVFQLEDENVGVKAAHKVELAGEAAVRSALRHRKLAPYKKVAKMERKLSKRSAKLSYQRALHENPKLKKNPIARMWQKRKIKRKHAKAAREAQKAAVRAKKAATLTGRAMRAAAMLIKKNPKVWIAVVVLFVLINIVSSLIGMLSSVGSSGAGAIFATTYLSEEQEIEAVSLAYSEWEMDLLMEILNAETNHPGFDEYRFNTGEISHSPFELMAYLTATRHIFTFADIEAELRALFAEQYQLSFTPSVETRYRDDVDGDGNPISVPYDWHVMTVTLTARNFTDLIFSRMNAEQRMHFDLLMQTRGQRQIVANPFSFSWQPFITSEYGYRIHPIYGTRNLHRGIDIGVPLGTEILAGFDGTVTFAGVSGGFGNVVMIQGANGLEARYAHMDTISVSAGQDVDMGDVIGTVGNTGTSTGAHLHLEILRNGQFLNPIFFTDMGSFDFNNPGATLPNNNPPRIPMGEGTLEDLLALADTIMGAAYVWGGSGPNVFDCSGLVVWLFNHAGVAEVPRTTAQGLFNLSSPVSASEAQPGDLIFFQGTFSSPRTITHVGIYLGGSMLHTGSNPNGVEIVSTNTAFWQNHLFGFGRLN
jgi:murein DD-endopeptidase MepM/ murein hydrolase activator NlpD